MEKFFENYQYTFSALGSIGTLLAIVIAMYFGYKAATSHKTKLEASVDIYNPYKTYSQGAYEVDSKKEYLVVTITNTGLLAIEIPIMFCVFQSLRKKFAGPPLDADRQHYPVKIEHNSSKPFQIMSIESFTELLKDMSWLRRQFLKAIVMTNDGSKQKIRFSNEMKKLVRGKLK